MISSVQHYEEIIYELEKKGFHKLKAPWTVYNNKFNVAIDILPFGEIEQRNTVQFYKRYSDLHVLGFKEILVSFKENRVGDKIVRIPPLPGIVLLKLIAWSDRPEERDNDLYDIFKIIENYFDCEYDEIVEFHHDTFPEDDFDQLKIAERVLKSN